MCIHAKVELSDSQWEELQIEDYQNIELADDIEEKDNTMAVRKHRAKVLLEGEKPTKYFCSLQKVVKKHTRIMELHIKHEQNNGPPIIESIKDQSRIEAKVTEFYRDLYSFRYSSASAARLENFIENSPLIKRLNQEQRDKLEMQIAEAEVSKYLRGIRNTQILKK